MKLLGEITLGQSPGYVVMTGGLLKFIKQLRKVCTHSRDKNVFFGLTISMITEQHVWSPPKSKNLFFGSSISKFTKHHIRPTTREKKLLDAHPDDDCMWKNTDPCNISLDNTSEPEEPVNTTMTTTSIRSKRLQRDPRINCYYTNIHIRGKQRNLARHQ